MRRDKYRYNINLMPFRSTPTGRLAGLVGSGFVMGTFIGIIGLGSIVGVDAGSLLSGNLLGPLQGNNSPSERLIIQGSVIDIAKKAEPSIVGIQTHQSGSEDIPRSPGPGGEAESVGSGVIIESDGYIMTNSHVVGEASSIIVTIDDEKVPAEVVGTDPETDIAVIKVEKDGLPVARLGSTKELEVGELAVAIGSPFGFQQSVTAGVISALNRNVTVGTEADRPRTYTNLIQTDAAINPGNSGGALINGEGEVIGINTLIYSTNGVSQGIGFAIPVEEAANIAKRLVKTGDVAYSYIGIEGQTLAPAMGGMNEEVEQGATIMNVEPGGPADQAGLRRGDVVVEFAEVTIMSMDDLVAAVRGSAIDRSVPVRALRGDRIKKFNIRIGQRPDSF